MDFNRVFLRRIAALALFGVLVGAGLPVSAADLRISLPKLPQMSDRDGPVVQLAKAIAREWKEGQVTIIGPLPFNESVDNVTGGRADVHFPLIASPGQDEVDLPFRYSGLTLYEVPFALYSRQDNVVVDRNNLTIGALNKLRIETDRAHARLFFFRPREAESIESGLRRVAAGEIDGFLFSANATDAVLKKLKLPGIVRTPYRRFNSKMVFAKGADGELLDEKLGLIIDRLKDSGEYQRIMASVLARR